MSIVLIVDEVALTITRGRIAAQVTEHAAHVEIVRRQYGSDL